MFAPGVLFAGVDCNTPFGSSQQLYRAILPCTCGQLELFKFVPDEFVAAAGACAQTLCADQNEFPVSPCSMSKPNLTEQAVC